jgi:hypothetical protein
MVVVVLGFLCSCPANVGAGPSRGRGTVASLRLKAGNLIVGHSTYLPARLLALLHNLDFGSASNMHVEHKAGLTVALAQDVVKSTSR